MIGTEPFDFTTGHATHVGCRREINEDSLLARQPSGLWAVADGMGGHAAGDFASQAIVKELDTVGLAGSANDLEARVMHRLTQANKRILDYSAELDRGTIGATLAALLVSGTEYRCVWSGDSRIYVARAGEMVQLTRDHTEIQALIDAGRLSQTQARNWPRRNVITRAIGVTETVQCEVISGTLAMGDKFLLCSDGLTEHVSKEEISATLFDSQPQNACNELVATTLKRGARDNVTVIVVEISLAPEPIEELDIWDDL